MPADRPGGGSVADDQPRSPGDLPGPELAGGRPGVPGLPDRWFPQTATGNGFPGSSLKSRGSRPAGSPVVQAALFWRIGNSILNVVPTPTSLLTVICPACFCTMP